MNQLSTQIDRSELSQVNTDTNLVSASKPKNCANEYTESIKNHPVGKYVWKLKYVLVVLLAATITGVITIFWKTQPPICPSDQNEEWYKVLRIILVAFECVYFGFGVAFIVYSIVIVRKIVPELRTKILFICTSLSWFFISWFWHTRLHETFCGYWGILFLELFFHVPTAILTVLLMKYSVAVVQMLSGSATTKVNELVHLKLWEKIAYPLIVIVVAVGCILTGYYVFPTYVAESPPPTCPRNAGCPAVPCEIPPICTDAYCPSLNGTCGSLVVDKTFEECYADNSTYSDSLIASCSPNPSITTLEQCNYAVSPNNTNSPIVPPYQFTCNLAGAEELMTNLTGSTFIMPIILESCQESFELNLCLFCAPYRNLPPPDLDCASHLDTDQLVFDESNTPQQVIQQIFDIMDAFIVGIAVVFVVICAPYIYNVDDSIEKGNIVKLYLFVFSVFWNASSWFFHSQVHAWVAKPMRASSFIGIEIGFHFTVMLSSTIIAWGLFAIIKVAHEFSLSPYRSSVSGAQMSNPDSQLFQGAMSSHQFMRANLNRKPSLLVNSSNKSSDMQASSVLEVNSSSSTAMEINSTSNISSEDPSKSISQSRSFENSNDQVFVVSVIHEDEEHEERDSDLEVNPSESV